MKGKKIIFTVYDDLHREYRGFKVAGTFFKAGYSVKIFGVRFGNEKLTGWDEFPHRRIKLGRNFPLSVNMILFWIKLFFRLMEEKCDMIYSHDIFPLFPVYLASKLKGVPYIYDAHEFWHGNSQVEHRPLMKKIWTTYERIFIKAAARVITVSEPIARELENIYGLKKVGVFTNLPLKKIIPEDRRLIHRKLKLDEKVRIVLYQGGFLFNNGLDRVISAFKNVDKRAVLILIGSGSERGKLQEQVVQLELAERVFFMGPFPHEDLISYTVCADIGLCLIKNSGKSYYYSAPNKMFEFIQAGVPQIASDFPEMSKYVSCLNTGVNIDPENDDAISKTINDLINDKDKYDLYKNGCTAARDGLVWENIETELLLFVN